MERLRTRGAQLRRVGVVGDGEERRRRHPVPVQQDLPGDAFGVELLEQATGVEHAVLLPALEPVELAVAGPLVVLGAQRLEVGAVLRVDVVEVALRRPTDVTVEGEHHQPLVHDRPPCSHLRQFRTGGSRW